MQFDLSFDNLNLEAYSKDCLTYRFDLDLHVGVIYRDGKTIAMKEIDNNSSESIALKHFYR